MFRSVDIPGYVYNDFYSDAYCYTLPAIGQRFTISRRNETVWAFSVAVGNSITFKYVDECVVVRLNDGDFVDIESLKRTSLAAEVVDRCDVFVNFLKIYYGL